MARVGASFADGVAGVALTGLTAREDRCNFDPFLTFSLFLFNRGTMAVGASENHRFAVRVTRVSLFNGIRRRIMSVTG